MKLLGEYLIENRLIRESDLLDALITQMQEQPPIARIVRELKLLDDDVILEALKTQNAQHISFFEAAESLGLWDGTKTQQVQAMLAAKRTPVGKLLLDARCIDLPTLTKALDGFFAEKFQEAVDLDNRGRGGSST